MSHSESEPDLFNFTINLASDFDSTSESNPKSESKSDDSETDFNSMFMNLGICVSLLYHIPNLIVFIPHFIIFNQKRCVFTTIFKVFYISTHLR